MRRCLQYNMFLAAIKNSSNADTGPVYIRDSNLIITVSTDILTMSRNGDDWKRRYVFLEIYLAISDSVYFYGWEGIIQNCRYLLRFNINV